MNAHDYMARMTRDDLSVDTASLVEAYARGPAELRGAIAGMTAEETVARPVEGRWSTIELVCHLVGCDLFLAERIERTLAFDRPLLQSIDEGPYPGRLGYQGLDLGEQLDLFAALRAHEARVLRSLPAEDWGRLAVHSHAGLMSLRQLVLQPVRHLAHHLPFLAEKRAALARRG